MVERELADVGGDHLHDGTAFAGVAGDDDSTGFFHTLDDGCVIYWVYRSAVEYVRGHPIFLFKDIGGFDCTIERRADGHERDVLARAPLRRRAEGDFIVALRNRRLKHFGHIVKALTLEENDGVTARERGVKQALRIVRRGRKDDLEAGNVIHDCSPILRMLRPVFRADGHSQHERHFEDARGHALPLGHLVEDFIARAAHKVAIHELDERAPPLEGVADGRTDDCAFGDRRVEQAVIRQGLGKPAIAGERPTPVAVFLPVDHEGRVDLRAVQNCLKDSVAELVRLVLRGRFTLKDSAADLFRDGCYAGIVVTALQ